MEFTSCIIYHCACSFYLLTNHPIKNVIPMVLVLVFQNLKVVVDLLLCCHSRLVHKVPSIDADLPFRLILCNTLVQHILSKVC